jgi:hypothetical protein
VREVFCHHRLTLLVLSFLSFFCCSFLPWDCTTKTKDTVLINRKKIIIKSEPQREDYANKRIIVSTKAIPGVRKPEIPYRPRARRVFIPIRALFLFIIGSPLFVILLFLVFLAPSAAAAAIRVVLVLLVLIALFRVAAENEKKTNKKQKNKNKRHCSNQQKKKSLRFIATQKKESL